MRRNTLGCVLVALLAVVGAIGCDPRKKEQEAENSSTPAAPIPLTDVTPVMTKVSPLHKIPWPSDAEPIKGQEGAVSTKVGTVAEITAFYQIWMAANKWTFAPKNSTLDPDDGVKGALGYTTNQIWCKATRPFTTVAIIIGSGDNTDHGKSAQIIIMKLSDKTSCP